MNESGQFGEMLTVNDVAKRLNVAVSTVYGLIAKKRIRAHRIGLGRGTIRIGRSDLDTFLSGTASEVMTKETAPARPITQPLKHIKMPKQPASPARP